MTPTRDAVQRALSEIALPDGGTLTSRDMIRALAVEGGAVRFVIEVPSAEAARALEPLRQRAEAAVRALPGVQSVSVVLTTPAPGMRAPAQGAGGGGGVRVGGHPTAEGNRRVEGVARILAVASGKGGVGKSTVSANLAVALARQGRRVGLLDADIYGPSQPRMMGVNRRPASPDGKTIIPLEAHGVKLMSIGFMLPEDEAVIWRGPMLMGALQQLLTQVAWAPLDVLIVDMPPGTGDVQLTLCQRTDLSGAIVVSTPQDVALLDARKAIRAFQTLKTPILGLIENMSVYICPHCGHEEHIFGEGGMRAESEKLGLPFLGALPLSLAVREAGDAGTPIAATDSPVARPYLDLAARLIAGGMA